MISKSNYITKLSIQELKEEFYHLLDNVILTLEFGGKSKP